MLLLLLLVALCQGARAETPMPQEFQVVVTGKEPQSEVRFAGNYWDVHGKRHNVEIVECWYCGQVISETHRGCEGKAISGYSRGEHICPAFCLRHACGNGFMRQVRVN